MFNGQHTIEIVALVSGSRDTPVWCMIYDELVYEHEADIFANQQKFVKPLSPYEVFLANLEAGNDDQLIIRDLVDSYGLEIGTKKAPCVICAVSTVEQIYQKYGYHTLNRVLRLCIGTWEGDMNSFSANILNGITKLISVFGDRLMMKSSRRKSAPFLSSSSFAQRKSAKPVQWDMQRRCSLSITVKRKIPHSGCQ